MRKIFSTILLVLILFNFIFTCPARATEISNGARIFNSNCASCHIGGGNILIAEKNLQKEALQLYLENYENDSINAIAYQIKNGKNAMPAFKAKLSPEEILEVSAYIFQKAEQGWEVK